MDRTIGGPPTTADYAMAAVKDLAQRQQAPVPESVRLQQISGRLDRIERALGLAVPVPGEVAALTPELCRAAARAVRFADEITDRLNEAGRIDVMGFDLDYLASVLDDAARELEEHP